MESSEALFERAKKVLPGGVNSPVRAFRSVGLTPALSKRPTALIFGMWKETGTLTMSVPGGQ